MNNISGCEKGGDQHLRLENQALIGKLITCMICSFLSGCGVTANMSVLGTDDSGFESRHPD